MCLTEAARLHEHNICRGNMQTGHVVDYRGNLLNMSNLGRLPVTAEAVSRCVLFTLAPTVSLTQLTGLVEHSSSKLNIQGDGASLDAAGAPSQSSTYLTKGNQGGISSAHGCTAYVYFRTHSVGVGSVVLTLSVGEIRSIKSKSSIDVMHYCLVYHWAALYLLTQAEPCCCVFLPSFLHLVAYFSAAVPFI